MPTAIRAVRKAAESLTPLEDNLDFTIRNTRRLLMKRIETVLADHGTPLGAWFPLRLLYEEDGITQRELSRKLGYLDAAAGTIVEVMEKLRLVRRVRNANDRRKINVFLTPAGHRMGEQIVRYMDEVNEQIVSGFTKREADVLKALLYRVQENLA